MAGRDIAPRISTRGESASVRFERAFGSLRLMGKTQRRFIRALGVNAISAEIFMLKFLPRCAGNHFNGGFRRCVRGRGAATVFAHRREAENEVTNLRFWRRIPRRAMRGARVRIFFRYFRFLSFAPRRGFAMILQVIRARARGKPGGNL